METTYIDPSTDTKMRLLTEAATFEDFMNSFDMSAFPLKMHLGVVRHTFLCACGNYSGDTIHVHMNIKPRHDSELPSIARDEHGKLDLRTCTGVSAESFEKFGAFDALEKVRVAIKNMVMHEVYEALMFRGTRIMNPHDDALRPSDQPF